MSKIDDRIFNYDKNYPELFNRACDDVIQSKYIIAEGKISLLLQTIAANKYLYEFFRNAVDGFDFRHEYGRSQIPDGRRSSLVLPSNPVRLTAYVFCLLLDFDSGRLLLRDFLHTFFYSELGANVEYERFVIDIMVPFKHSVNMLLGERNEPAAAAPADNPTHAVFADITAELTRLNGQYDELTFLLAALKKGIDTQDKLLAQTAYIGSKNAARVSGVLEFIAPHMEKLRIYLIGTGVLH